MRRQAAFLTALSIVLAVVSGTFGAEADTRSERDQVRAEKARVAANINALEADEAELTAALRVLEENVRVERGRLEDAEQAVAAAEAQVAAAKRGIEESTTKLRRLRQTMREVAVEAYIRPPSSSMSSVLEAENASDAAERQALEGLRATNDADLVDQIRTTQAELQARRRIAAAAQERAERKRAEVQDRLQRVEEATAQQDQLVDQVSSRIQSQVARAADLQSQDKALSDKLYREQLALAARLAEQREAAERAARQPAYNDGGREGGGPVAPTRPVGTANVPLCNAGGITVNCQIAEQTRSMIQAASNAGVGLSGGGWRDPAAQIALRREHCGSSYYAIYQMPSGQCSPPTARPGQSMHELGLAIDFNNCSSSSNCYRWLSANAGSYGFRNLPGEPWHWSVNGQ